MSPGAKGPIAGLLGSSLALLGACVVLLFVWAKAPVINTQAALADPELRSELVRRLTSSTKGIWDTHNDPEVGRVMQPNLTDAVYSGVLNQTNRLGLREKEFELPKPPGTLRVVLLGDSYVHGFGVEAGERVGAVLERFLREHASSWSEELECLHVAVGGWNAIAECAYLRRTLTEMAPDLVLHVLIGNDTEDQMGTRGFGELSAFTPLAWNHTDARVHFEFPVKYSTPRATNFILEAADFESRHRYERMAGAIARLVPAVRGSGAHYLAVAHWGNWYNAKIWRALSGVLAPEEFASLPPRFFKDKELIRSSSDQHWSVQGHELVARLLFTLIRARGLLPELSLTPWPEAEGPARAELEQAWKDTVDAPAWSDQPPQQGLSSLEPAKFTELEWRHVYTGLDDESQASPFASFYLARKNHTALVIRGSALDRPELAGARVRVSVEGIAVGEQELVPSRPFEARFRLPAGIERRGGINVRLETSDYGYTGRDRQHCISFVLERLALE
jgi:hypothetical protein